METLFNGFMYDRVLLAGALVYWLAAGGLIGALLGSRRGKTVTGFLLGALLNVLGWWLLVVVYERGRVRCFDCGTVLPVTALSGVCPACSNARARSGAGVSARRVPKNAPSGGIPVPQAPGDQEDIVFRLINHHKNLRENLEYAATLPPLLRRETQWRQFSAVETFIRHNVHEHFRLEEEVLFPWLRTSYPMLKYAEVVDALNQEHADIRRLTGSIEEIVAAVVFPLKTTEIERLNNVLSQLSTTLMAHTKREDEQIYAQLS